MNSGEERGWKFILTCWRSKLPASFVLFAANILEAYLCVRFALNTQSVIDCAAASDGAGFQRACLLLLFVILGTIICYYLRNNISARLLMDLDMLLKEKMLHRILGGQYEAVSAYHSGDLVNRMNNDVNLICSGFVDIIPSIASLVTQLVGSVAVLLSTAPEFTVILIAFSLMIVGVTYLVRKRLKSMQKTVSSENGKTLGFVQEIFEKLLMIQALDVTEEVERRGLASLQRRRSAQKRQKNLRLALSMGSSVLSYSITFLSMWYFAARLLHGEISFGKLTALTQLTALLEGPLLSIPMLVRQVIGMSAAADRIDEVIAIPPQAAADTKNIGLADHITALEARNVTFSYRREEVIRDVSFRIPIGGMTVITGSSGIGKSTLLKLLMGIYPVEEGELVAVTDDGDIPLTRATRGLFSYVPQGNFLLSGTIRENMCLSKPDASQEDIDRAIFVSTMGEYLDKLPEGIHTPLGESGKGLSEGQGQRLALARAVLRDAPILLLDEVTSSLDMDTEKKVLSRIRTLTGVTCIVVTHRAAVLEMADMHLHITKNGIQVNPSHFEWENAYRQADAAAKK